MTRIPVAGEALVDFLPETPGPLDSVETVPPSCGRDAGDAFTAGAIAAAADGESIAEALAFANAGGALTTTARGTMTALPTREAIRRLRE